MAMLYKADFFQAQINECRHLAAHSKNHNDREFWVKMAQRWQGLLEGHSDAPRPSKGRKSHISATICICKTASRRLTGGRRGHHAARSYSDARPLNEDLGKRRGEGISEFC